MKNRTTRYERYEQMLFERFVGSVLRPEPNLGIAIQNNPTASIRHLRPHYTDDRFKTARTVYLARGYKLEGDDGETVKGAHYNYSDRYRLWFTSDLIDAAWDAAKAIDKSVSTAAAIEAFLRHVHQDPELKLVHIMAGFNVSNGFDYQVYGYIPSETAVRP
jgi:hypothetical protein